MDTLIDLLKKLKIKCDIYLLFRYCLVIKNHSSGVSSIYTQMYPLKQSLYSAQKIAQTSSQMTQVPIPLNVMNSCQNAMLENSNSIIMNDISLANDDANNIPQV